MSCPHNETQSLKPQAKSHQIYILLKNSTFISPYSWSLH